MRELSITVTIIIMIIIIARILFPKKTPTSKIVIKQPQKHPKKQRKYTDEELKRIAHIQSVKDKVKHLKKVAQKDKLDIKTLELFKKIVYLVKDDSSRLNNDSYLKDIIKLDYKSNSSLDILYKGERISFKMNNTSYFDDTQYTDLCLIFNEDVVFKINLCKQQDYDELIGYYGDWRILEIDSFISGEWQNSINEIYNDLIKVEEIREKNSKLDLRETNELKKKFGIK